MLSTKRGSSISTQFELQYPLRKRKTVTKRRIIDGALRKRSGRHLPIGTHADSSSRIWEFVEIVDRENRKLLQK